MRLKKMFKCKLLTHWNRKCVCVSMCVYEHSIMRPFDGKVIDLFETRPASLTTVE